MSHQVHRTLIVALTALFVASTLTLAADTKVSGTIQAVDMQKGFITLRSEDGDIVDLRAPTELLAGLQTGDVVEVKTSGRAVTEVSKKESTQRSRPGQPSNIQQPR
jgi:hypothetical protein